MTFIFIKGLLEVLNFFQDGMLESEQVKDYFIFDISNPDLEGLQTVLHNTKTKKIMITFNNQAIHFSTNTGENVWEKYHVTVYNYLVDHPIEYIDELRKTREFIKIITIDRKHKEFIEKYFYRLSVSFLPHGGIALPQDQSVSGEERDIDILYVGDQNIAVNQFPVLEGMHGQGMELLQYTVRELIFHPEETTESRFYAYLDKNQLKLSRTQQLKALSYLKTYAESYVRNYYKGIIFKILAEEGFRMEIYGKNWEFLSGYPNISIHSRVSSPECIRLMQHAKIVLNIMPWFKDGSHERIYNAVLNGAACVSDDSSFLREKYSDVLTLFSLSHPEELPEKLHFLLENEKERLAMVKKAKMVMHAETWGHRLDTLLVNFLKN